MERKLLLLRCRRQLPSCRHRRVPSLSLSLSSKSAHRDERSEQRERHCLFTIIIYYFFISQFHCRFAFYFYFFIKPRRFILIIPPLKFSLAWYHLLIAKPLDLLGFTFNFFFYNELRDKIFSKYYLRNLYYQFNLKNKK